MTNGDPDGSTSRTVPDPEGNDVTPGPFAQSIVPNPLLSFGVLGVASLLGGILVGTFVAIEWFVPPRTGHQVLALVAAVGIVLGAQLIILAVLADVILTLHRERVKRLQRIEELTGDPGE